MTDDEIKFREFCLRMYHANNKERKAYGEKQYDNFKMYYKSNFSTANMLQGLISKWLIFLIFKIYNTLIIYFNIK